MNKKEFLNLVVGQLVVCTVREAHMPFGWMPRMTEMIDCVLPVISTIVSEERGPGITLV